MKRCAAAGCLALIAWVTGSPAARAETVNIAVTGAYPSSMPALGDVARRVSETVSRASGGDLVLTFHAAGDIVPASQALDAVVSGKAQATWATAGSLTSKDSAFGLFSGVPFGPSTGEYLAWLYYGGGLGMAREMFHRYGLHDIPCGLIPPEGSGWFQREIKTVGDLKGLRMRFFGLGAKVMEKYGVVIQPLPPDQILPAFQSGALDAAEFLVPSVDKMLGFDKVAKYYYFPGWHQRVTIFDLYVNKATWDALPERHRTLIELACGDQMRDMLAENDALQWKAMKDMQAEGVQLKRWPLDILLSFQTTWNEVAAEESVRNPNFKRVYDSYADFRQNYKIWRNFNFLN